jgi:hypothetical protein
MAWIESHDALARHPKTRRAARALNISVPQMIGHLHCLWWWALEYAEGAMWEDDPGALVTALCQVGFLDMDTNGGLSIHDWAEYTGRLIAMREANAEKQRRWRETHRPGPKASPPPRNVTDTSPTGGVHPNGYVTDTQPLRTGTTVPNQTVPNQTIERDLPPAPAPTRETPRPPTPIQQERARMAATAKDAPVPPPLPWDKTTGAPRPLPADFPRTPTPEMRAWVSANAPGVPDLDAQHRLFLTHYEGATDRDWGKRWRLWMQRPFAQLAGATPGRASPAAHSPRYLSLADLTGGSS